MHPELILPHSLPLLDHCCFFQPKARRRVRGQVCALCAGGDGAPV